MNYEAYQRDLAEVLRTFDEEAILGFFKKHNIPTPSNNISFWGAVHKMRLTISGFSEEEKAFSREWLRSYNMEAKSAISENLQSHIKVFSTKFTELSESGMREGEAGLEATKEANKQYPLSAEDIETMRRAEATRRDAGQF